MGDLQDLKNLSAKDALEGNMEAVRKILSRYNAGRMIIATFYEGTLSRLEVHHYIADGLIDHSPVVEFDANNYAPATLLALAMRKVIEASKITLPTILNPEPKTLYFTAIFNNYPEWIELQKPLENLQGVKKITINTLSLKQAKISLTCSSSETFIENQLKAKDIIVEQEARNFASKTLSLRLPEGNRL